MKKMYEHHGEELQKLMIKVKDTGAATSLDMAAVDSAADVGHIDWKQILEKVIPYVDFFMPSAEELCYMLDKERFADWQKRAEARILQKYWILKRILSHLPNSVWTLVQRYY